MKGKFIAIDGGDGAGKDTQIDLLEASLGQDGIVYPRDPGGTPASMDIRKLVLAVDGLTPKAELLLFLSARAQLVEELIAPSLENGVHVICNRFGLSTIAYQVYGNERLEGLEQWRDVISFGDAGIVPDLYILLDVDAKTGMERTAAAKGESRDRFERKSLAYHERVNSAFRTHIADYPNHLVVDANQDVGAVSKEVIAAVKEVIGA